MHGLMNAKGVTKFTSAERADNVAPVACCSDRGAHVPPSIIFKEIRFSRLYPQDLNLQ
jgi:hypothetical protein